MKFNQKLSAVVISVFLVACGGGTSEQNEPDASKATENEVAEVVETSATIDPMQDKGVGPVTSITLGEIDESLVEKGKEIFKANCTACHKVEKRFVGPAIGGVIERRTPEWIMNMILNPEGMVTENEQAKKLLAEYNAPMANQNLTEEEARAILEFFRTK